MIRKLASLLFLTALLTNLPCHAEELAGTIVRLDGSGLITAADAVRSVKAAAGDRLTVGSSLKTKMGSLALVRFVDGSKAVLKEDSILEILALKHDNVAQGTVLFEIRKQGGARGMVVTSKTVTMGIRGTRFGVISTDRDLAIYLKEGTLEIGNMEGDFKRLHQSLEEDFHQQEKKMQEEFKKNTEQMRKEFERATKEMEQGNYEMVKQFTMESGNGVVISGNEVRDSATPPELDEDFKLLDTF